jgi:parallel beta-helix repeat protein
LEIKNYRLDDVSLLSVDDFHISQGSYRDNEEYGIYPIYSSHGRIELNHVSGSADSGIYVGQSEEVLVRNNLCTENTTGIEIENSSYIEARENLVFGNSLGITAFVLPGLTVTKTAKVTIESNVISSNNRPNLATDPSEIISLLPSGVGVLLVGADQVKVQHNVVLDNDSVGVAVIQLPPALAGLDPRIDPFPDQTRIKNNLVLRSGHHPDLRLAPFPGADLIWDLSGIDNSWKENTFVTSFPTILPGG